MDKMNLFILLAFFGYVFIATTFGVFVGKVTYKATHDSEAAASAGGFSGLFWPIGIPVYFAIKLANKLAG